VKRFFGIGLLVLVVMFGMAFIGCDSSDDGNNGSNYTAPDIIPSPWQGTYLADSGDTFTLHANGTASWTSSSVANGSWTGIRIASGGTVTLGGLTGTWVYVTTIAGSTVSFVDTTPGFTASIGNTGILLQHPGGIAIAMLQNQVNSLLADPQLAGAVFTPSPVITNPYGIGFGGEK
jgi:hypothetical protein